MDPFIKGLIGLGAGGAVAAAFFFFGGKMVLRAIDTHQAKEVERYKSVLGTGAKLMELRLQEYAALFALFRPFASYGPKPEKIPTPAELSASLSSWYYGGGGIVLSEDSKSIYLTLQEFLKSGHADDEKKRFRILSLLRSALCADVCSRRELEAADKELMEEAKAKVAELAVDLGIPAGPDASSPNE